MKTEPGNWAASVRNLGDTLATNAAEHDRDGSFVADNYAILKAQRLFSAGIPEELGGGGASHADLCNIVRELSRHCGSTALSFAMHSHPVAANVFKYLRGDQQAENTLRKLAAGELVVAGTGANDWLASNGEAIDTEGGYRVNAHKRFVSGGPGADVFVTSAVHDGDDGLQVLHFAVPMNSAGVEIQDNWNTLGMRGTGSNDILMKDVFVPEAAIVARRPIGAWHPMWNVIVPIALPIIVSCYVGLAEKACELALSAACGRPHLANTIGKMQNELMIARSMLTESIRAVDNYAFAPDLSITNDILMQKTVAARSVKQVVEIAAELVGGSGFFRNNLMERVVRDIRALHYHPLPEQRQRLFSGRIALGLSPIEE
jgi:alkylation response protein AidB-like acyl-CoA dehydrogenase